MNQGNKDSYLFQNVILTLSDGTEAKFSGPAIVHTGDTRTITNIEFSEPTPLPEGYRFEETE